MPNVLVLGSGMVSRPLVQHLLAQPNYRVTVGDMDQARTERVVAGHPNGRAIQLNAQDLEAVGHEVEKADVVVSILPVPFHPSIAELCVEKSRHFVSASYGKSMAKLDEQARAKGLILLNEMGLDPGIDHLSAMQIIDRAHSMGGKVRSFTSYCGGLPAPEANTNLFGYKFSWAPRGVLSATGNNATFLNNGQIQTILNAQLFQRLIADTFEGIGTLEGYPNRDSLEFIKDYGIEGETLTMIRGTYRYPGWCQFWDKVSSLNMLSDTPLRRHPATAMEFTQQLIGRTFLSRSGSALAQIIGVAQDSDIMRMVQWLGLFSDEQIPESLNTRIDILAHLALKRMQYAPGERDMSVLHHVFEVEFPDRRRRITSTLIEYGIPYGDSSMARTVGLNAAIGAKLILEGKVNGRGVIRPTTPDIYEPALAELDSLGIRMIETEQDID